MAGKKRKPPERVVPVESLKQLNLNAAGLDIGAAEIWACVPADRDEQSVRVFGTCTADLEALADWLEECGIETVAMESTGIYWIPAYEILEARGFEVCLVNARHLKNVPGRKSDVLDCQWIQQLHTYGLLRASFHPEEQICALRTQQIEACDAEIERQYEACEPQVDVQAHPLPPAKHKPRRQGNEPAFDLLTRLYETCGVDLTRVDGLDVVLVQDIISEIGVDMSPWKTEKHFASWLRLCPHNDISGGKVLHSKTGKTQNRANLAFRLAARSVSRSDSALGAFYRRMRAKHGAPKAITATAHKIARIVYHMLKYKEEYVDPGQDYYEAQCRERAIRNLKRKAKKLGLAVIPAPTQVS